MTSLSRGRPSIAESEPPQNIKIALAARVTGKTWKACAAEAGVAYSTLRDWLRNNENAKYYLKKIVMTISIKVIFIWQKISK